MVAKGEAPEGKKADGERDKLSLRRPQAPTLRDTLLYVLILRISHEGKIISDTRWANNHQCIVTLSLSDEDFGKLVGGKTQAQRLFMSGKLKVKGDVMKATKMEPILKKAQTKAKL